MRKKRISRDAGQSSLDEFRSLSEASSTVAFSHIDTILKKGPKSQKTLVEEQVRRPEIIKISSQSLEMVRSGMSEKDATRWFEEKLKEARVPTTLISTIIVRAKMQNRDVWKKSIRMTYYWLSWDLKHKDRSDAGRSGGKATAIKKLLQKMNHISIDQAIEKDAATPTLIQIAKKKSAFQAITIKLAEPSPFPAVAVRNFSKHNPDKNPSELDGTTTPISANTENFKVPPAWYLIETKPYFLGMPSADI